MGCYEGSLCSTVHEPSPLCPITSLSLLSSLSPLTLPPPPSPLQRFSPANFERDYGSMKPSGSSLGEGCFDKEALSFDRHGKHDFARAFASKEHPVPSMIAGTLSS